MKHNRQNFLRFCTVFFPFTLLTTLKIKILKILKERHRDIILHVYHMIFGSWDKKHNRIFCHFGPFTACLFTPLTTGKIKFWKNEKKHAIQVCHKSWSYAVLFLKYCAWRMQFLFVILGYFCPFTPPIPPPLTTLKIKIKEKIKKSHGNIIILHKCTKN